MARLTGLQRILEVGMILTSAFAIFLLLAIFTFDPADPSWSQTGQGVAVTNAAGAAGAWIADILQFSFGYVAWVFPFLAALLGWFLFKQMKSVLDLDYLTISLRVIGIILLLLGSCGIASLNIDDFAFPAGGFVGDVLSSTLLPVFNVAGSNLLLLVLFTTGFTLLTGISWLSVVDLTGLWTIKLSKWAYCAPKAVGALNIPRLADMRTNKTASIGDARPAPTKVTEESSMVDITTVRMEPSFDDELDEPPFDLDEPAITRSKPKIVRAKAPEPVVEPDMSDEELAAYRASSPMPTLELLDRADKVENPISEEELQAVSRLVEEKLADFNIDAQVVGVYPGPVITRFELDLAPGVKVSKISGLSKDLARALSAISVRVVEVIPGKSVIGLELPNKHREMVRLSEVLGCSAFQDNPSSLTMVLGKDIGGKPVVVDLAKMPHLLVAGTTGSGKSVGVNVMILSLLYKSTPEDVRLIMIDPKMLELSVYEGIPHLLAEVVTDMKEAANALRWCVGEMERRYRLMSALGVRNLKGFNAKVLQAIADGKPIKDPLWRSEDSMLEEAPDLEKLPAIVVVVDEFADMMMIVGKKVEELIARIAQKARAAGIHLVLATQRPSVDVITGLIKANIPTRIAFQVSSKIDSRTILDQQGAEALLGQGDMLYMPPGTSVPTRVHGAFVDDHEVHAVVNDWKKRGAPQYIDEILNGEATADILLPGEAAEGDDAESDALYDEAVAFVTKGRKVSVSLVQRQFRIGYNRAARIVEQMEQSGVVSAPGHNGSREVLAPPPV
ncbi:DNA translocase FtsK [Bowmanella sp. JS7-9]|uniref:DNA translocase FtsK n=1 Tax=Pseudobowmanella zhangzhouensis TaxID=1537679 RepID=A0ABW1XMN8_9ALTE|nr:DNA translocase FtsK 4TM domain-containing protein [Bowmanella sp. JS7-9]TBX26001.1 cell division protein FtsK [Bowmanella sp. JS7-9]